LDSSANLAFAGYSDDTSLVPSGAIPGSIKKTIIGFLPPTGFDPKWAKELNLDNIEIAEIVFSPNG
jgi:hypothetical protein